ncbi:flagellar cap protein FliD N-terminal domain-containing protein, partial [Sphingomonas sp. CCH20-B6]|uniref:flagellar cap protein FliD N-terminal domain-containing protein n=1 Tax=Sphingomonas sp. CCH20-B6 TaxID=1768769 RepID=UPI000B3036D3
MESITSTLGAGSGINITELVNGLVEAQFAIKTQRLEARSETLTAQISAVGSLKSGINNLASALGSVTRSGTLATQPTSGNPNIVRASPVVGTKIENLSASIEVRQLATAQSSYTAPIADPAAAVGTGTLTLTLGTATVSNGAMTGFTAGTGTPVDIAIDASNSSLTGIRDAINAARAGVTASIVADSAGSRLILKGATGEAQAFTLTATEDAGAPGLAALNVGVGAPASSVAVSVN